MSSDIFRIEIYDNEDGTWSYGCPDENLMGYNDIETLIKLLKELEAKKTK